jgi:RNA polymerase sigma-70 factor, ECF subfamily
MMSLGTTIATSATGETSSVMEADLVACIPPLRIFARSLTRNYERADDLVQDTVVRALAAAHQFQAGTNLKAWMFTILRNLHCDDLRKKRVWVQSLEEIAGYEPAVLPNQEASLELGDFDRAVWQLDDNQRKALILVGADGLSYEEAAKECDCPTGTVKSRVSRARRELLRILEGGSPADSRRAPPSPSKRIGGRLASRRPNSLAA